MERLKRFADRALESHAARPPTIVIALDQAEELFIAENAEASGVLDLLAGSVQADANAIIIATIRSDAFAKLQGEPRLAEIPLLPFSLPPIPLGAFKDVIEGPARLANPPIAVEPALSDRLLQDLAAEDALPLLAFTLERLSSRHRGGGMLTLAEYVESWEDCRARSSAPSTRRSRKRTAIPHCPTAVRNSKSWLARRSSPRLCISTTPIPNPGEESSA